MFSIDFRAAVLKLDSNKNINDAFSIVLPTTLFAHRPYQCFKLKGNLEEDSPILRFPSCFF